MGQTAGSSDVSFAEAFNRRDMAEADRAVAEAANDANKRNCTNSEESEAKESELTKRNVRQRLNFDESDDDGALSYISEEGCDENGIDEIDGASENPSESRHGALPRHRRLGHKIPSANTDYSKTKLVTKAELKRLNEMKAEQAKRKAKEEKAAKAKAVEAIRHQPELSHGAVYVPAKSARHVPHSTHDVRHFAAANTVIIFCNICGRWQRHDAGRSKLEEPCEDIREGSKSQRKLLRFGIVPGSGAKLPAHIKTSGGKRC